MLTQDIFVEEGVVSSLEEACPWEVQAYASLEVASSLVEEVPSFQVEPSLEGPCLVEPSLVVQPYQALEPCPGEVVSSCPYLVRQLLLPDRQDLQELVIPSALFELRDPSVRPFQAPLRHLLPFSLMPMKVVPLRSWLRCSLL
jgi:hypothetical protein